jgi:hypothetical protein
MQRQRRANVRLRGGGFLDGVGSGCFGDHGGGSSGVMPLTVGPRRPPALLAASQPRCEPGHTRNARAQKRGPPRACDQYLGTP